MFRGCWHILFAIGLALCAVPTHSQEQPDTTLEGQPESKPGQAESTTDAQNARDNDREDSVDYTTTLQGIEAAIRDLIADVDQEERERQKQREIDDLDAQTDMAFWAQAMFWATLATVFITTVGIYLIAKTLYHTRRAADYANEMVTEAKKTTELVRDASIYDHRPWIDFEMVRCESLLVDEKGQSFSGAIKLINIGKTPARNVFFASTFIKVDYPDHHKVAGHVAEAIEEKEFYENFVQQGALFPQKSSIAYVNYGGGGRDFMQGPRRIDISIAVFYRGAQNEPVFCTARVFGLTGPNGPTFSPGDKFIHGAVNVHSYANMAIAT